MPTFWECQRCTACCRWPGQVRLTPAEVDRIAAHLQLEPSAFIEQFTQLDQQRRGLALTNQPNGACIFLDGDHCRIQPVKPQQCRDFPNLWNFPGFEKTCHALPHSVDEPTWRQRVAQATGRPAASLKTPDIAP